MLHLEHMAIMEHECSTLHFVRRTLHDVLNIAHTSNVNIYLHNALVNHEQNISDAELSPLFCRDNYWGHLFTSSDV